MKRLFLLSKLILFFFIFSGSILAQRQIIELKFKQPSEAESDTTKVSQSIVKARDISEQYATGGLYLMTHKGDFNELFQKENQKAIDFPMINETWRFCSVFSIKNDTSVILGRNWDNQNVGSIIVSLYKPSKGYFSISFSRAIDMGFPLNVDLEDMISSPFGNKLLLTPFYIYDGINEHGLCISVAGVDQVTVNPVKGKELIFVSYLIRKILDQTKTVEEALSLVERYIPFDINKSSLNCHFLVSDATSKSVILEYRNDEWQKIYPTNTTWQIMTNKVIFETPEAQLEKQCWRYKKISETLENTDGKIDWQDGMQILRDVSQRGTTWSVIYSPTSKDIYSSVYQSWDKIYHIKGF